MLVLFIIAIPLQGKLSVWLGQSVATQLAVSSNVSWKIENKDIYMDVGTQKSIEVIFENTNWLMQAPDISFKSSNPDVLWVNQNGLLQAARKKLTNEVRETVTVQIGDSTDIVWVHIRDPYKYYIAEQYEFVENNLAKPLVLEKPITNCSDIVLYITYNDDELSKENKNAKIYISDNTLESWEFVQTIDLSTLPYSQIIEGTREVRVTWAGTSILADKALKRIAVIPEVIVGQSTSIGIDVDFNVITNE